MSKVNDGCSISDYLSELKNEKEKMIILSGENGAKYTTDEVEKSQLALLTTWQVNFNWIKEKSMDAFTLIKVLAFLPPERVLKDVFRMAFPPLIERSTLHQDRIFSCLRTFSLIEEDDERIWYKKRRYNEPTLLNDQMISLHRLVRDVLKENMLQKREVMGILSETGRILSNYIDSTGKYFDKMKEGARNKEDVCMKVLFLTTKYIDEVKHISDNPQYEDMALMKTAIDKVPTGYIELENALRGLPKIFVALYAKYISSKKDFLKDISAANILKELPDKFDKIFESNLKYIEYLAFSKRSDKVFVCKDYIISVEIKIGKRCSSR